MKIIRGEHHGVEYVSLVNDYEATEARVEYRDGCATMWTKVVGTKTIPAKTMKDFLRRALAMMETP